MDNLDRAKTGSSAMAHFTKITEAPLDQPTQDQMVDLVTALMHAAYVCNIDYTIVHEKAESQFAGDILGEVTWG